MKAGRIRSAVLKSQFAAIDEMRSGVVSSCRRTA
jgi:hypothetical protein